MITDSHLERVGQGRLPSGTVRGTVEAYDLASGIPDPEADAVRIVVVASDLPGIVTGQVVDVVMPEPADVNFCVSDLRSGFDMGGLDPVPEGGEVAFEHCVVDDMGRVEAASYDLATIVRPGASPSP